MTWRISLQKSAKRKAKHLYDKYSFMCFILLLAVITTILNETNAHAGEAAKVVKTVEISQPEGDLGRTFFGRVSAKQTTDLAFQVGGQVVEFPVIEGEVVKKGELIARLDPEPFELAVQRARLSKAQADRDLSRLQKLQGATVSKVAVEEAATQAGIADVSLGDSEYAMKRSVLVAPFDAMIANRTVANFTTVSAGTVVARVHDMSELRIEINVPEILFQKIGDERKVSLQAEFPASAKRYPIEFREVDAEASQIGQTFRVTLGLAPPPGLLLLPGSSVLVHATLPRKTAGYPVPPTAIYTDIDGKTSVMRMQTAEDGTEVVAKTAVEIRIDENGTLNVIDGLADGDVIVAAGVQTLSDGQSVQRFTSFHDQDQ